MHTKRFPVNLLYTSESDRSGNLVAVPCIYMHLVLTWRQVT